MNPIDVKRAAGYGRRLLGLKGAATLPVVLGNDIAGVVQEVGPGVSRFSRDQAVFGLVGTGRAPGAHASHVLVPQEQLVAAPDVGAFVCVGGASLFVHDDVARGHVDGSSSIERHRREGAGQRCQRWPWPPGLASVENMGQPGHGDLRSGHSRRLRRAWRRTRGRTRPGMHRITVRRLRRRPELRLVGRRSVAGLASRRRRVGTCDHRPSTTGQLRSLRLAARRAGEPPRLDESAIAGRQARATGTLCVDRLQTRPRGTRCAGRECPRARAFACRWAWRCRSTKRTQPSRMWLRAKPGARYFCPTRDASFARLFLRKD